MALINFRKNIGFFMELNYHHFSKDDITNSRNFFSNIDEDKVKKSDISSLENLRDQILINSQPLIYSQKKKDLMHLAKADRLLSVISKVFNGSKIEAKTYSKNSEIKFITKEDGYNEKFIPIADNVLLSPEMYYKDKSAIHKKEFLQKVVFGNCNDADLIQILSTQAQENPKAEYLLAVVYEAIGKNELAEKFYEKAAKSGHPNALYALGMKKKNHEKIQLLMDAANLGHPLAMLRVGMWNENKDNLQLALEYYIKSFNSGCVEAAFLIEDINPELGKQYIEKSNDLYLQIPLSYFDENDVSLISKVASMHYFVGNWEKALEYFLVAYNFGDVNAALKIAGIYQHLGENSKAIDYYEVALDQGMLSAAKHMGEIYKEWGDYNKALAYYALLPDPQYVQDIINEPPWDSHNQ